VNWVTYLTYLTYANAYVELENQQHILGCGYSTGTSNSALFRIKNDGIFQWYYKIGISTGLTYCYGISYDETYNRATVLVSTTDTLISYGSVQDNALIIIDNTGTLIGGKMITLGYAITPANIPANVLFKVDEYLYFGGQTAGYSTSKQSNSFTSAKTNVFVMKYLSDKPNSYTCLSESDISANNFRAYVTSLIESASTTHVTTLTMASADSIFKMYSSPYSGAFSLLDTMIIPRPCAYIS
jgi:hypothetical protein